MKPSASQTPTLFAKAGTALLRLRRRPPPPLPFVPFHPVPLSEEDIRAALAHRQEEYAIRAVMQIIAGELRGAIDGMAYGRKSVRKVARGEFSGLDKLHTKLQSLIRPPERN